MLVNFNNINIPEFMDSKFFEAAFKVGFNGKVLELKNVLFTMGPKPGENYIGHIYRADATYNDGGSDDKKISLIIKVQPSGPLGEHFGEMGLFTRERDIYVHALPEIERLLDGEALAPRFLYYTPAPVETFVFVDVTSLGYILADRVKGLDEEHCGLVFEKLAKFHAASKVLAREQPEVFRIFSKDLLVNSIKDQNMVEESFIKPFEHLAKVVETWPGFKETAEKLCRFISIIPQNLPKWFGPAKKETKVLAHNDLWANNILFKYENGKPIDLYFIDFQGSVYSSPGLDFSHFLYTNPQFDVLDQKRDLLIEACYYKTFKSTLENLGYSPIPTLENILEEIAKRETVGFVWAVVKLFLVCMDPSECGENSLENLTDKDKGDRIREIGMSSKRFVTTIQYVLRRMEKIGVLK
ncbi:unnamed protein product [Hermetia illucens]|uniref:CHK kinase-like domain-containing protein n=2 Tax=Hermetia illucens TaxID=343691 RepID=A0A7R8V3G5_HERIL|nr:uncharacterized protein LOC119656823 isoform X2 [Hermetia illucens]XP_037919391.1 uncharacterized protein LOC119656823 isoform X2 [Hermetia illucens]XP_037919392.1 uncharacterized protein LOC119656823 isoform X2 [Hermetia illucens]CAD7091500.1 unnamed protein product [Hermetia illucens]